MTCYASTGQGLAVEVLRHTDHHLVPAGRAAAVASLYEWLGMSLGPDPVVRRAARVLRWPPPLAWDGQPVDRPAGQPPA